MLHWKKVKRVDPRAPQGEKKYGGLIVNMGVVTTDDLAKEVAERNGHSTGQVLGMFRDYFTFMRQAILQGRNVSIKPLGTLVTTLNGVGANTKENWDPSYLLKVNIYLRKSSRLRTATRLENPDIKFSNKYNFIKE